MPLPVIFLRGDFMPGPITHLKAAYAFLDRSRFRLPREQFYLGSVCPDSVNINGHAAKSLRWPAHLRDENLDIWQQNAEEFLKAHRDFEDKAYLFGYIMHIITDIVWDRSFDKRLYLIMAANGVKKEDFKERRWQEIYGFEAKERGTSWGRNTLLELSRAKPLSIGTVRAENVLVWRDMIVSDAIPKGSDPVYLSGEFMNEFIEKCVNEAEKIIK